MYFGRWMTATSGPSSPGAMRTPPAAAMSGLPSPISKSSRPTDRSVSVAGLGLLGLREPPKRLLAPADDRVAVREEQVVEVEVEQSRIGLPQSGPDPLGVIAEQPVGEEVHPTVVVAAARRPRPGAPGAEHHGP